jgi:hypothetical protein
VTAHLIAVVGSSPGVGKSTLCDSLVRWLDEPGVAVDHFEEAHIPTRPEFQEVAEEFADGAGSMRPRTLVDALRRADPPGRAGAAGQVGEPGDAWR